MILWRLLPWRQDASPTGPGGALWFPRELQGEGRHDNPDRYGCLYVSESPVSTVCEALAPFRGTGALTEGMMMRGGVPLALARLELSEESRLVDLDDPVVLSEVGLRPSKVATGWRPATQVQALRLYEDRSGSVGIRWWSTIEASLLNVTLFDRALSSLRLVEVVQLAPTDSAVREAAEVLGLV